MLKGKAVLVVGGDSGIGRSVAVLMAREGADVLIVYLPEEDAQDAKKMVEKVGRRVHLMALDLRESKNCRSAVEEHMGAFGKLSVLANSSEFWAGVLVGRLLICDPCQARCKRSAMVSEISNSMWWGRHTARTYC